MENSEEYEKRVNKARSHNCCPHPSQPKLKNEPAKRKSFNVNEAVRSLDLALGRLKKSKLVNGECTTALSMPVSPIRREPKDMFMDVCPSTQFNQGIGNTSLMSMNFSHYELVRNVSSSNCFSDGALSCTTCNVQATPTDSVTRNEHLERFFRSAEMWSQKYKEGPSNVILDK